MKRALLAMALLALALIPALLAGGAGATRDEKVRGITLSTHTDGGDWASDGVASALSSMREVGATWVAVHPYAGIRGDGTVRSHHLDPASPPEHLARPIREAHARGLRIVIVPHLAYWGSPFRWRGDIAFTGEEEWARFWSTYTDFVTNLVETCRDADAFVLGSELDRTLGHEAEWRALIADVRARTEKPLSYGANWTHYRHVPFWDALDVIGIQAYFPLADSVGADSTALAAAWSARMRELREYAAEQNRRICFTELGYNRSFRTPVEPWAYAVDGPEAEAVQRTCLRVALEAIEREDSVVGSFLWKWFPDPRPVGRNFQLATPALKEAIAAAWGE